MTERTSRPGADLEAAESFDGDTTTVPATATSDANLRDTDGPAVPVLAAHRSDADELWVWCAHEATWHRHDGSDGPDEDGLRHRSAHCICSCSPYVAAGYYLDEVGPLTPEVRANHRDTWQPLPAYPPFSSSQDWRETLTAPEGAAWAKVRQLVQETTSDHAERHQDHDHPWCAVCAERLIRPLIGCLPVQTLDDLGQQLMQRAQIGPAAREVAEMQALHENGYVVCLDDAFEIWPIHDPARLGAIFHFVEEAANVEWLAKERLRLAQSRCARYLLLHGRQPADPWPNLEVEAAAEPPSAVGLDDFLDEPDPEVAYRIDGLWPVGGRVVLSAQYKAGKSTLVGNIVRSIADGTRLFDRYAAQCGSVALLDNELDERTLRAWLRDQAIENGDQVDVVPLRGRVSSFNILDGLVRKQWAEMLKGYDVVVLDCLRPVLDALGLDESKDAGKFLVAFDELLAEAGVSDAMVVHHMGHAGERSRGDSRILDWPDATWKIVREKADDADSPRFFSAFGRDVSVHESRMAYDRATRGLTIVGGNRLDGAIDDVLPALVQLLSNHLEDGLSKNAIEVALVPVGHTKRTVRAGIDHLLRNNHAIQGHGAHNSKPIRLFATSPLLANSSPASTAEQFASSLYMANGEQRTSGEEG